MAHTFAFLDVSAECITEIKDKMEKAGYGRAIQIHDDAVVIDMYGIALRQKDVAVPDDGKGELREKVREFVKNHASLRRKSAYQNSHEANAMFSPAYDFLKQIVDERKEA